MNGNLMDTNVIVRVLNGNRQLVQHLSNYDNNRVSNMLCRELCVPRAAFWNN